MRALLPVGLLPLLLGCGLFQAAKDPDTSQPVDTGDELPPIDTADGRHDASEFEGDDSGECSDGLDNDLDGDRDCDDSGCADSPECLGADDTGNSSGPGGDGGGPGGDDTGGGPGGDGGGPGGGPDDTGGPPGGDGGDGGAAWDWGWLIGVGSTGADDYYVFLQGENTVDPGVSYDGRHWLSIYDSDLSGTLCSWMYTEVKGSPASPCGVCDFAFDTSSALPSEVGGKRCDDFELDLTSWSLVLGYQHASVYSYWGIGTGTFWYEYSGSWYRNYYSFSYYYP